MEEIYDIIEELSHEERALFAEILMPEGMEGSSTNMAEPIAIIGMGCRFPGGGDNPHAYWDMLQRGGEGVKETPVERWDHKTYFDADVNVPGKMNTRWGGFLENVDQFDAFFFGISPREADHMDPQQRIFLMCAWEALEDAGQTMEGLAGSQTGVYAGVYNNDYKEKLFRNINGITSFSGGGTENTFVPNRISYLLDLRGPSIAVDTVCSSSLVSIQWRLKASG